MKLTEKDKSFIKDIRSLIEQGETFISLKQFEKINPIFINELLRLHLGVDVWICGKWKGMFSFDYYISTNFETHYIVSEKEIIEYNPAPFTICEKTDRIFSDKETANRVFYHLRNFDYNPNKKQNTKPWYKRLFS